MLDTKINHKSIFHEYKKGYKKKELKKVDYTVMAIQVTKY